MLILVATTVSHWTHELGRVVEFVPTRSVEDREFLLYHLHIPKTGGTTLKTNLPIAVPTLTICDGFPNKPYSNPTKFRAAAAALQNDDVCKFVSVEGDMELHEKLLAQSRRHIVTFTLLRDPLLHTISEWRHDVAKGKFARIEDKYAPNQPANIAIKAARVRGRRKQQLLNETGGFVNPKQIGFVDNLQTNRLGAGSVEIAKRRLLSIEFGVQELFHQSICVLLFALNLRRQFDDGCVCGTSPLTNYKGGEISPPETAMLNVTLKRIIETYTVAKVDRDLYNFGLALFLDRLRFVENETKRKLLC